MTRALVVAIAVAAAVPARADSLGATTFRLANGLTVILAPDPSLAVVVVHVRYEGGTRDDPEDREDLARLVAQLADAGSAHVKPGEQAAAIHAVDGWNIARAEPDYLAFASMVPRNALALALYFEADRLAGFPAAVTAAAVDGQRPNLTHTPQSEVVRALWSDDHRHVDLRKHRPPFTAADVEAWWRSYASPANATLVVTGGFDTAEARRLCERYFAWIPSRPPPARAPSAIAPLHDVVEMRAPRRIDATPHQLLVAFRTDVPTAPSTADLEIAARLLAAGKTSRLYRRLVVADRVATEVSATVTPQRRGGQLTFDIALRDGAALDAARAAVFDELAKLRRAVAPDELARAKARFALDLETALELPGFRAEILAALAATGDQLDALRARIEAVSTSSLQNTAARWLADHAAAVMVVVP